jgi:hypothetical protein
MGVPASEVGYTPAMPRREDHEVHKDMLWHWGEREREREPTEFLTTNHEVPGSIPGSTVGIFPEGEDSRGDHALGRLVEFMFKVPPGTTSSCITTHISGTT